MYELRQCVECHDEVQFILKILYTLQMCLFSANEQQNRQKFEIQIGAELMLLLTTNNAKYGFHANTYASWQISLHVLCVEDGTSQNEKEFPEHFLSSSRTSFYICYCFHLRRKFLNAK